MLNDIISREIKNPLLPENYQIIGSLIKKAQPGSILSCLSQNLIKKYIEISIKSENLFFYVCEHENKIIGYTLWARNTSFLTSEFKKIRYSIFINLFIRFKIKTIANILLSLFKLEFLLLSKDKRNFINNNLILSLIAFEKKFQSKGIGKVFCSYMFRDLQEKYKFKTMIVEPYDDRAIHFFKNKFNCKFLGKKIRFFKNIEIYYKNID